MALGALLSATSCHNPYAKYYSSHSTERQERSKSVEVSPYTPDRLAKTTRDGATLLGDSRFCYTFSPKKLAIRHAKTVGANLVLLDITFRETMHGVVTLPMYHAGQTVTSTTYDTGSVSAYGSGGSAYGRYSGTSTTYTTLPGYTTYHPVPYTVHLYDHVAYFLRDPKRPGIPDASPTLREPRR